MRRWFANYISEGVFRYIKVLNTVNIKKIVYIIYDVAISVIEY